MKKYDIESMTFADLMDYIGIHKYDRDEIIQKYDRVALLEWALDLWEQEES